MCRSDFIFYLERVRDSSHVVSGCLGAFSHRQQPQMEQVLGGGGAAPCDTSSGLTGSRAGREKSLEQLSHHKRTYKDQKCY